MPKIFTVNNKEHKKIVNFYIEKQLPDSSTNQKEKDAFSKRADNFLVDAKTWKVRFKKKTFFYLTKNEFRETYIDKICYWLHHSCHNPMHAEIKKKTAMV